MENKIKFNAKMALANTKIKYQTDQGLVRELGEVMEYIFKQIKAASYKDTNVEIKLTSISDHFVDLIITKLNDLGFYTQKKYTRSSEENHEDKILKVCWDRVHTELYIKAKYNEDTFMYFSYDMSNGDIIVRNVKLNGKLLKTIRHTTMAPPDKYYLDYYIVDVMGLGYIEYENTEDKSKYICVEQHIQGVHDGIVKLKHKLENRTIKIDWDECCYNEVCKSLESGIVAPLNNGLLRYQGDNNFVKMLILMMCGVKEITDLIQTEFEN